MTSGSIGHSATSSLAGDPRWGLVQRIAVSPQFEKAGRLRELLLYTCEKSLSGQAGLLHEQQIGCDLFGRAAGYNTTEDNIVRVVASQLRKRLESYFAGEGLDEPVVIRIPRGGYVPVFESRNPDHHQAQPPAGPAVKSNPISKKKWWLYAAALLVLASVLYLMKRPQPGIAAPVSGTPTLRHFWSGFFSSSRQAYIVVADSGFALLQDRIHESIPLTDYLGRGYWPRREFLTSGAEEDSWLEKLASGRYTSVADVQMAAKIHEIGANWGDQLAIRFPKDLTLRDLKGGSSVLLGSERSNPWVGLFKEKLVFQIQYDHKTTKAWVRDLHPLPGEREIYLPIGDPRISGETYGIIAYVPNPDMNGSIVILAGTGMEGTEAAGEFVTNEALAAKLLSRLSVGKNRTVPYFEALVKLKSVSGTSSEARIIAHRVIGVR